MWWNLAVGLFAALLLSACGESADDELRQWMAEQRNAQHPAAEAVAPPKQFDPQPYTANQSVEPFAAQRLIGALRAEAMPAANQGLMDAEMARPKDPLEAYPLDAMAMVGSLRRGGQQIALIRVDKLIYPVKVGEHLGQNFGKVIQISDAELVLREIVQDGAGEWIEKKTTLQLQEGVK